MTTATIDTSARYEAIKLILALVFVCLFLLTTGWALLCWIDEGPTVRYTPPAYSHHNNN
jgi:hypothetical protein